MFKWWYIVPVLIAALCAGLTAKLFLQQPRLEVVEIVHSYDEKSCEWAHFYGNVTIHDTDGRFTLDGRGCVTSPGATFYLDGISWVEVEGAQKLLGGRCASCAMDKPLKDFLSPGTSHRLKCFIEEGQERQEIRKILLSERLALP